MLKVKVFNGLMALDREVASGEMYVGRQHKLFKESSSSKDLYGAVAQKYKHELVFGKA